MKNNKIFPAGASCHFQAWGYRLFSSDWVCTLLASSCLSDWQDSFPGSLRTLPCSRRRYLLPFLTASADVPFSACWRLCVPQGSILFRLFCLPYLCCSLFRAVRFPCTQLSCLYGRFLPEAMKCAALPSNSFHCLLRYYDDIGLPATRLLVLRLFRRLTSYTLSGCNGTSAVPITHLRESLLTSTSASPCSQTGGCLPNLATIGQSDIACCHTKNIGQIPLNNHFPAQSLRLRYGSAAPCPTLRVGVTASLPRTRYGRLARPYSTGLPCCDVISLQRSLAQPVENRDNPVFTARTFLKLYHKLYWQKKTNCDRTHVTPLSPQTLLTWDTNSLHRKRPTSLVR